MAKADVSPRGELSLDSNFFVEFGDLRSHQVRLEGGDASSDSYCFA
jgi:selenium-binding protein 1